MARRTARCARHADQAAAGAEAAKLVVLFKDAQQFWTARSNKEAADWAAAAMGHAAEIEKAAKAGNAEGVAAHQKELGRHLHDLPHEVSRKDRDWVRDQERLRTQSEIRDLRSEIYLMVAAIAIATPPSVISFRLIVSPAFG